MRTRDIFAFFAKHCGYTPAQTLELSMDELRVMFYALDKVIFDERKFLIGNQHGSKATRKMNWKDPDPEKNAKCTVTVSGETRGKAVGAVSHAESSLSRMLMDPRHRQRIKIT